MLYRHAYNDQMDNQNNLTSYKPTKVFMDYESSVP